MRLRTEALLKRVIAVDLDGERRRRTMPTWSGLRLKDKKDRPRSTVSLRPRLLNARARCTRCSIKRKALEEGCRARRSPPISTVFTNCNAIPWRGHHLAEDRKRRFTALVNRVGVEIAASDSQSGSDASSGMAPPACRQRLVSTTMPRMPTAVASIPRRQGSIETSLARCMPSPVVSGKMTPGVSFCVTRCVPTGNAWRCAARSRA